MQLLIKRLDPNAKLPTRAKPGDSGLDLSAFLPEGPVWLDAGETRLFRTGIAIELPDPARYTDGSFDYGYEAQVRPRSSFNKQGILAGFGTVDNGYRGEVGVTLSNMTFRQFKVSDGDRIAQLVVAPVMYPTVIEVSELSASERGDTGFGSTGV